MRSAAELAKQSAFSRSPANSGLIVAPPYTGHSPTTALVFEAIPRPRAPRHPHGANQTCAPGPAHFHRAVGGPPLLVPSHLRREADTIFRDLFRRRLGEGVVAARTRGKRNAEARRMPDSCHVRGTRPVGPPRGLGSRGHRAGRPLGHLTMGGRQTGGRIARHPSPYRLRVWRTSRPRPADIDSGPRKKVFWRSAQARLSEVRRLCHLEGVEERALSRYPGDRDAGHGAGRLRG
jgi:hypothetical protein